MLNCLNLIFVLKRSIKLYWADHNKDQYLDSAILKVLNIHIAKSKGARNTLKRANSNTG